MDMKFVFTNNTLNELLGTPASNLKGKSIKNIMPELISSSHDHFIKRFIENGTSTILGRPRVNFIKKANGFIIPVKILIDFHFNQAFGYSFISSFETKMSIPSHNENGDRIVQP